jgi:hypothetical protein
MMCRRRCWVPGWLVDVDGLAAPLAVSVGHVRSLVATGRVPYVDWGAGPRFDPAAIDAWLAAHIRHPERGDGAGVVVDLRDHPATRRRTRLRLVPAPVGGDQ